MLVSLRWVRVRLPRSACRNFVYSACCGAMRFNGGTVDQNLRRRPTSLSQCAKQIDPHALRGPAHVSIIECLPRAYSGGASTQRAPDFRTCTMPLITRRSSTRALPRVSVGRCGLIFEKLRFRQPKLVATHLCLLFGSRESRHYVRANTFMGPDPNARPWHRFWSGPGQPPRLRPIKRVLLTKLRE